MLQIKGTSCRLKTESPLVLQQLPARKPRDQPSHQQSKLTEHERNGNMVASSEGSDVGGAEGAGA